MMQFLIFVGALVALKLLGPAIRLLVAAVAPGAVSQSALSKLPDEIHLTPADGNVWKNRAPVGVIAGGLRPLGFADAGTYTITEMPGVVVRLMVQTSECFYAAIYEHPQAGVWFDLVTRYTDGTSITFTTAKASGLNARPGHPTVNVKQLAATDVCARAREERPQAAYASHTVEQAPRDFEAAYAESMAWRKNEGVSREEVVRVALKKAA